MSEWTSIPARKDQKESIEEAKKQAGHKGTIGEFLVDEICTQDDPQEAASSTDISSSNADLESTLDLVNDIEKADQEITDEIIERLARIEEIAKEATQTSQSNQNLIESLTH